MAEPIANDFSFIRARMEQIKPSQQPSETAASPVSNADEPEHKVAPEADGEDEWDGSVFRFTGGF